MTAPRTDGIDVYKRQVQDTIHQIYQERNQRQEARLRMYLVLVSVLSLISLFAFLYICLLYTSIINLGRVTFLVGQIVVVVVMVENINLCSNSGFFEGRA